MSPAQTAAVEWVAVAEEQQGRRAQAALADCPRRLHSFPRQPRPEHRRPLQSKNDLCICSSLTLGCNQVDQLVAVLAHNHRPINGKVRRGSRDVRLT